MLKTKGKLPSVGEKAPQLRFVKQDRTEGQLNDLSGSVVVVCSIPSIDTGTCAQETRTFNKLATGLGAKVLVVSMDLPFAFKRFCEAEGIENVITGSDFRHRDASEKWGAAIAEGAMESTLTRVVWIIDQKGVVQYMHVKDDLSAEPDYDSAIAAVKKIL